MEWQKKVVVITGSSMGIGFQLAREAGRRGALVVINARNPNRLAQAEKTLVQEGIEVTAIDGDIASWDICRQLMQRVMEKYGRIDALIHNAGVSTHGTVEETDYRVMDRIMNTNFTGAVYLSKLAIPFLKKTGGNILFVSSVAGIHGLGGYSAYCTSKMALTALAESLQAELSTSGIYVGIAYVGFTENEPGKTILDPNGTPIPHPVRSLRKESREKVARRLLNMIDKERFKMVFSPLGKFTWILNRLSPSLVQLLIRLTYLKENGVRKINLLPGVARRKYVSKKIQ
jgi:NAD(P)-dependent dehydrogenase (short-subunit alcohol dehydrogenase family)